MNVLSSYVEVQRLFGFTEDDVNIAHYTAARLSAMAIATITSQTPLEIQGRGLALAVARGFGEGILDNSGAKILNIKQHWQASIVTWPTSFYYDTSIGTYIREVSFHANNASSVCVEVSLPILEGISITNGSKVECKSRSVEVDMWELDNCSVTSETADAIICKCAILNNTLVAASIQQPSSYEANPADTANDKYTIKFRMLTGYQWALIIGVGTLGIAILLGAFVLSRIKITKQEDHSLFFVTYTAILNSDKNEPDVTIDDLSVASDEESNVHYDLSFSEEDIAADTDDIASQLCEDGEIAAAPNSTRLSRMGVQEGATGYVVSSTTLRNTLETDYDLEQKENVGPITGTALRIRAQSVSTESPPSIPQQFNTASRYTLTATRPKLTSPSVSRATGARIGFARGDSLRAIPAAFFAPPSTNQDSPTTQK
jgi:hypothetical protein